MILISVIIVGDYTWSYYHYKSYKENILILNIIVECERATQGSSYPYKSATEYLKGFSISADNYKSSGDRILN